MSSRGRIQREVETALKATGLDWEIKKGGHHRKVFLAGKMIGVLCNAPGVGRDSKQVLSSIRQRLRELGMQC